MGRPTTPAKKSSPGGVSKVISKSTAQSDNFLLETIHKHFAPYFWPNACLKRGYKLDDEHSTPCTLPECVQARPLLEHIRACQKPNCSFPDCILTKTCLDHFDLQQACCIFYLGNPKFKSCTARINEIHKFIIKSVRSENCLLAKRTCFDSQCAEMKSLITHYGQCQMKSECEFPLCTFRDHTDQHMTQNGQQCCVNYMSGVNFDICITKKLSEAPEAQKSILTPDLSQHLLAQQSCAMPFSSKTTVEKTIELLKLKSAVESQLVSGIFPTIFGNKPAIMEQIWMLFLNFYQQMTETDPVKFDQHNKKEAQRQKLLSEELETKQANLNAQIEVNHISVPQLKSSTQQAQEQLLQVFSEAKRLKKLNEQLQAELSKSKSKIEEPQQFLTQEIQSLDNSFPQPQLENPPPFSNYTEEPVIRLEGHPNEGRVHLESSPILSTEYLEEPTFVLEPNEEFPQPDPCLLLTDLSEEPAESFIPVYFNYVPIEPYDPTKMNLFLSLPPRPIPGFEEAFLQAMNSATTPQLIPGLDKPGVLDDRLWESDE